MEKVTAKDPLSHSADIIKQNLDTLKTLFPTIVKEGKIDVEELKALAGEELETNEEYYRFTWAGKSMARQEANKPSTGTLRPVKEDSKDWNTTHNIFIEGDNLEVLKLLQKSYANKIKIIYIDPPYNTGNDFVYKDDFTDNLGSYLAITNQADKDGTRLNSNTESDGRYHSNWLNMMYPRLKLARNLLKEDGLIFISIDDNEVQNLRKLCDEIFGEENLLQQIIWKNKTGGGAKTKGWIELHEYILCYSKNISNITDVNIPYSEKTASMYNKKDENYEIRGPFATWPLDTTSMGDRPNLKFPIIHKGKEIWPEKQWLWSKERVLEAQAANMLLFNEQNDGSFKVRFKGYLKDENGVMRRGKPLSILEGPYTQEGSKDFEEYLPKTYFPFPKPVQLLQDLFSIKTEEKNAQTENLVLDFFAGSGTAAEAIWKNNIQETEKLKFILVQLPEKTAVDSDSYKAGYKNIAQITKERLRRAGEKIRSEFREDLFSTGKQAFDIGFKCFKLDRSNINAWDGNVQNFDQTLLSAAENIKPDRTEEDVLYEILLKSGLDLAQPIEERIIAGKKVFNIGIGALFICLANDLNTTVAEAIGKWKVELDPATCRVIFKDTGFNDVEKTNSIQILKRYGITEVNTI